MDTATTKPRIMKLLIPFLFVTTLSWGQSLFQTQTIGQSNNRNQRMGKGFQLGDAADTDTFLVNLNKIWFPYITAAGGATDSVLSLNQTTRMVELVPQGTSGAKVDSVIRHTGTDSVFYYIDGTGYFGFIDSIGFSTLNEADCNLSIGTGTPAVAAPRFESTWVGVNAGNGSLSNAVSNLGLGCSAGNAITGGDRNTIIGTRAQSSGANVSDCIIIGLGTEATGNGQCVIGSSTPSYYFGNTAAGISGAGSVTMQTQEVTGTNAAGFNVTWRGGRGTGQGLPGDYIIQTYDTTTSGTTPQTAVDAIVVKGNTQYVGIGESSPTEQLHVAGSLRMVDGNEGTGKIMTSDANGVGSWQSPAAMADSAWMLLGNSGTDPATNFAGTIDSVDWVWRAKNLKYAKLKAWGSIKLSNNDSLRYDSTAINTQQVQTGNLIIGDDSAGYKIPYSTNPADTFTSYSNTIVGLFTGHNLTNAWGNQWFGVGIAPYAKGVWGSASHNPGTPYGDIYENIFMGLNIGHRMRKGWENCAFGINCLFNSDSCMNQNAFGLSALYNSRAQTANDAFGTNALFALTTGTGNSVFGSGGGQLTTTGSNNTYIGQGAGASGTTAFSNVMVGTFAGLNNTGAGHVFIGLQAGQGNTSGAENLIIGEVGGDNITTQSNQVSIGKGYVQGTYSLDTTHTWMWGTDVQNRASNTIRLNGRVAMYGSGGAAAGKVWQAIESGGYGDWGATLQDDTLSSTAFIVTNVDSVSILGGQWERNDSTITVSGVYVVDADSAGVVEFEMSLPVASDFTFVYQLAGTAFDMESEPGEVPEGAGIYADIADNRAAVRSYTTHTDLHKHSFHFTYRIK